MDTRRALQYSAGKYVLDPGRNLGWIALAAGVLGAGALWLWSAGGRGPITDRAAAPESAPLSANEAQRLRAELARVQSKLARAERRIAELESAPGAAQPASPEPTEVDQRGLVAQAFDAEPEDPNWAPEGEIQGLLAEALPAGSSLRSVVCRSTLCKVETSHMNQSEQQAFVQAFGMPRPGPPRPFNGAMFDQGEPSAGGRELRSVTYLVRRGHAFPSPD
jgi:hypothetical protein